MKILSLPSSLLKKKLKIGQDTKTWKLCVVLLFWILQFSFRSKDKYDKKYKPYRSGLGEVNEGNESNDSDQTSKVEAMSEADVDRYLEQMLVSVRRTDFFYLFLFEWWTAASAVSVKICLKFAIHCFYDELKLQKCWMFFLSQSCVSYNYFF